MLLCRSLPPARWRVATNRHRASLRPPGIEEYRRPLQSQPNPLSQALKYQRDVRNSPAPNPNRLSDLNSGAYLTKIACFSARTNGPRDCRSRRSVNRSRTTPATVVKDFETKPECLFDSSRTARGWVEPLQTCTRAAECVTSNQSSHRPPVGHGQFVCCLPGCHRRLNARPDPWRSDRQLPDRHAAGSLGYNEIRCDSASRLGEPECPSKP